MTIKLVCSVVSVANDATARHHNDTYEPLKYIMNVIIAVSLIKISNY